MIKFLLVLLAIPFIALAGPELTPIPAEPTFNNLGGLVQTLFNQRSATFAVYPSYDPYITVGGVHKPYGFGLAVFYPVSEYAFAGARLDFLGNTFWAPSAVVGAKYTLKNLPFQPTVFTVAGLIMPLGGAGAENRVVGAITGLGATATLYHKDNFSVNAFISGEKWTTFDGAIVHPGIAVSYKF